MNKSANNQYKARQRTLGLIGLGMLCLVALVLAVPTFGLSLLAFTPKLFCAALGIAHKGTCLTAGMFFGTFRVLRDKDPADGNGSFEKQVLAGVKTLTDNQTRQGSDIQKVLGDLDRLDKEGKKAMDELTTVKNKTNATVEEIEKKIAAVQRQVIVTARSSFRNPVERALASNEQFRFTMNALARYIYSVTAKTALDPAFKTVIDEAIAKQKALTGVDSSLGQATVPQETFNEIYDLLLEYGDFATLGVQRVGARTTVLPVATARPQFYWIGSQTGGQGEGSQITSGAFTGGEVVLIIQTLAVLMYISRELLADSTVDLAPYTTKQMITSCNWGFDTAAFLGTGNADQINAGYVGIFNAALANTNLGYAAGPGSTSVALLKLDDFVNTMLTVSAEVLNRKPMWWMHPQMIARTALIRDNMGRPIFQTWQEVPNPGQIGSILGFPVHPTAIAPAADGPSQPVAAFGEPDGQAVGIRSDLELATSADIGFPQNLMAYRTLLRGGVKLKTLPGSTTLKPIAVLSTSAS